MENGWELTSGLTSKWITFNNTQSNFTPISLITFAVIKQTSPNLQGSCRINSQCCLQNYMENGWELTSELTSKWITFNNSQSNFTPSSLIIFAVINQTSPNLPNLPISLITYAVINQTSPNLQEVAIIKADVACKTTWKTVKNWRLNWRLNE